jgi:hypothetical protein
MDDEARPPEGVDRGGQFYRHRSVRAREEW